MGSQGVVAPHVVTFHADGSFGAIYSDDLAELLRELGPTETTRISDVEPEGDGWMVWIRGWVHARLTGCLIGSCLASKRGYRLGGRFATRAEALAAEVRYLEAVL